MADKLKKGDFVTFTWNELTPASGAAATSSAPHLARKGRGLITLIDGDYAQVAIDPVAPEVRRFLIYCLLTWLSPA